MFRLVGKIVANIASGLLDFGAAIVDTTLKAPTHVINTADKLGKKLEKTAIDVSYKIDKLLDE